LTAVGTVAPVLERESSTDPALDTFDGVSSYVLSHAAFCVFMNVGQGALKKCEQVVQVQVRQSKSQEIRATQNRIRIIRGRQLTIEIQEPSFSIRLLRQAAKVGDINRLGVSADDALKFSRALCSFSCRVSSRLYSSQVLNSFAQSEFI
jgi:hypothetical protein